jgi:Uma2 family endonuclease
MTSVSHLLTADELQGLDFPDKQIELVRGRLVVSEPPGTWHGTIAARLTRRVGEFVERAQLGVVCAQDTGFRIAADPDTVRAPDLAFVARDRATLIPRRGYAPIAPDLVVEILSPEDRPSDLLAKIADWLGAGTKLVWVLDPDRHDARVHRADGSLAIVDRDGSLDGEDVLPGFTCPLRDVLI